MAMLKTKLRRRRLLGLKRKSKLLYLYWDEEGTLWLSALEREEHALRARVRSLREWAALKPRDRRKRLKLAERRLAGFMARHGGAVERARRERVEAWGSLAASGRSARHTVVVGLQQASDFIVSPAAR